MNKAVIDLLTNIGVEPENIALDDLEDIMTYKKGSSQYVTESLKRGDNIRLFQ